MSVNTGAGTRLSIGAVLTADLPTVEADALAIFTGGTYVEVGEVETIGDYGDEDGDVTFTPLAAARVLHLKGASDAGTAAITVGLDAGDAGQIAMAAAQKNRTRYDYPFKVEYPDGEIDYFVGKVMSVRKTNIANSDVVRRTYNIGINSGIFEVAAP
jgi:hypothetical protein